MFKKFLSLILTGIMMLALCVTVFATEEGSISEVEVSDYLNEVKDYFDNDFADDMLDNVQTHDIKFSIYVESVKNNNPNASAEELVDLIDWDIDFGDQSSIKAAGESISDLMDEFDRLTDEEKTLTVLFPKEALIVYSCAEMTDEFVADVYGNWIDGDEGNAYRHALWNAFMTQAFCQ